MVRIVVHAGFHKTGTTTVQKTLRKNRAALRDHCRIILRPGMEALCETARGWSETRSPLDLSLVAFEAAQLAQSLRRDKVVLLSSEDLSGHMPGRRGLKTYAAAPTLMKTIDATFREVLEQPEIHFVFSTRAAAPWLASCHVQHLRATRLTLTARDYARKFRASAGLAGIVDKVAKAVPDAGVHSHALESCDGPLGPLAPLLAHVGVPPDVQASLQTLPRANTAPPPEMVAELLALNQSDLEAGALRAAKKALRRDRF